MSISNYKSTQINVSEVIDNYDGDEEIYFSILDAYVNGAKNLKEKLNTFFETENWESYMFNAHTLKGLSYTVGARLLGDNAFSHEKAAKELNCDFIKNNFFSLIKHFDIVVKEAKEILDSFDMSTQYNELNSEEMLSYLNHIREAVLDYRTEEAEKIIDKIYGSDVNGKTYEDDFDEILEAMSEYNIDRVSELIDKFKERI